MSHHFDSEAARIDPRIDLCDVFVFAGQAPATTTLVATVHPHRAGARVDFRPDAAYDFHLQDDAEPAVIFRVTFDGGGAESGEPHAAQRYNVRQVTGDPTARPGTGPVLGSGHTDASTSLTGGGQAWAGRAADPFFFSTRYAEFSRAAYERGRIDLSLLDSRSPTSFFADGWVLAVVLEVPTSVHAGSAFDFWCSTSVAHGDVLEQVQRHALPIVQLQFNRHPSLGDAYNRIRPGEDVEHYREHLRASMTALGRAAGIRDPDMHGAQVSDLLLPNVLRYDPREPAVFTAHHRNGRDLRSDAMDAMWSLYTGIPIDDHVDAPDVPPRPTFPYLAEPAAAIDPAGHVNPKEEAR